VDAFLISLLNGLSYGLLLFLLASGLALILSMMGVLNFAHGGLYMLGAYIGFQIGLWAGFWAALVLAPLVVGVLGAAFEQTVLRRVHASGHAVELLVTFGLAILIIEAVQLVWGRSPLTPLVPAWLDGPLFTLGNLGFPRMRAFIMAVAVAIFVLLGLLLAFSRLGLVIRAALTHPHMVEALGHDVARAYRLVFGMGAGLAGLAGVLGGLMFVTEPGMAMSMGSVLFVVIVVGGLGSLSGALLASIAVGLLQTLVVSVTATPASLLAELGLHLAPAPVLGAPGLSIAQTLLHLPLAQVAPMLPWLLLVTVLVLRPQGLMGRRDV